jgi:hypothetical protein
MYDDEILVPEYSASARTRYFFFNTGDGSNPNRSWYDCKKYGFMIAGEGQEYQEHIRTLEKGDILFAYLSKAGYVGMGEVIGSPAPQGQFVPPGQTKPLIELPLSANTQWDRMHTDRCDWCIPVRWTHALEREAAVMQSYGRRPTRQPIRDLQLVKRLAAALREAASEERAKSR